LEIQAICHACILVQHDGTTVLIDPWITGLVFLGGWGLEPPPIPAVIDSLPEIQHIYLTHEHPDHTHVASLKLLFSKCAKDATVHIPRFMTDRFVRHLCGVFPDRNILEMRHGREYRIGGFRAWSYQYRNDDSALVLEDRQGDCLANLNDTFIKGLPLSEIHRLHPRIKTIMSQFSVSNAYPYGYADYEKSPESFPWSADDLKSYCVSMLGLLKPERWVPYHSFVSFCRDENGYLNRYRISLDQIADYVGAHGFNVVKLYPGDRLSEERIPYPGGEDHFRTIRDARIQTSEGDATGLHEAAATFEKSFCRSVSWPIRRALRPLGFVVSEDGSRLLFHPSSSRFQFGDTTLQTLNSEYSWTTTNRQTLTQALKLPWGMGNLLISGRMRTEIPERFRSVDFRFWAVALIRNTGYFRLSSLWFLRIRALDTAFRRRIEAADIIQRSFRAGGFLAGNIEPRRQSDS
jgi:L-ascorbate metabolism protein UlaG (beta-lactamase superfamily)